MECVLSFASFVERPVVVRVSGFKIVITGGGRPGPIGVQRRQHRAGFLFKVTAIAVENGREKDGALGGFHVVHFRDGEKLFRLVHEWCFGRAPTQASLRRGGQPLARQTSAKCNRGSAYSA